MSPSAAPDDPYALLGVARDATDADLRRAFLVLAKRYHPDLNPNDKETEDRFKRISAAHDLLSNRDLRQQYDLGYIDANGQSRPRPIGGYSSGPIRRQSTARPGARPGAGTATPAAARAEGFDPAFGAVLFGLFDMRRA